MNETRRNTMVGGFMMVGMILLGWLFWIFGEAPEWLGTPGYKIAIRVVGLYGISESTVVELNGVPVGRVLDIEFEDPAHPRDVNVIISIDNKYDIPADVQALIQPGGFGLARGRITLVPRMVSPNTMPRDSIATIKGTMTSAFSDIISDEMINKIESAFSNVGELAESLIPAAEGVERLLEQRTVAQVDSGTEQLTANVATLVERLDMAAKAFNETIGDPEVREGVLNSIRNIQAITDDARIAAENLKIASETVKTEVPVLVSDTRSLLGDARNQINVVAQKTIPVLENLDSASSSFSQAGKALVEGNGTLALFLRDPRFYESLTLSVQRLTDLIDTLRRMSAVWEQDNAAIRIRGAPL